MSYSRSHMNGPVSLIPTSYLDSDWGGDTIDRKSISAHIYIPSGKWTNRLGIKEAEDSGNIIL